MATGTLRVKKANIGNTELIPVAPGYILRSCEVKRLTCASKLLFRVQYCYQNGQPSIV